MPLEPPNTAEVENAVPFRSPAKNGEPLSVVDRVALKLMRTQIYGTLREQRWDEGARRRWDNLYEEEREAYRVVARALLADIALGDNDELTAWPEYQVRRSDGAVQGGYDDISNAVGFQEKVWTDAKIFRRTFVSVSSEWAEVTA